MKVERLKALAGELELQTDLWWLAMMMGGFMATFLAAFAYPSVGEFFVWLAVLLRIGMALCLSQHPWGGVFGRLLAFGLATGVFQIFADWCVVNWHQGGQRIYPAGSGVLLASPLYMPLFWACSIVEFGYAIVRLYGIVSRRMGGDAGLYFTMLAGGLVASIWTACTDFWAVKAGWWSYQPGNAIMGGACALYVVLAHLFIFAAFLPVFSRHLECPFNRTYASVRYGAIYGGVVFLSYVVAHVLAEKGL